MADVEGKSVGEEVMPISMPGDPPPKPSHRWVLPIVLALFFAGIAVPFLVVRHHTSVVENNQNQAIDALRNFARLQDSYFAVNKRFAISFEELGGPWIEIKDMRAQKSTDYHGYRFRFFASSVQSPDGSIPAPGASYGLIAVPTEYGNTGRFTFFISNPAEKLYYDDLGVKTDATTRTMSFFVVPGKAGEMSGK